MITSKYPFDPKLMDQKGFSHHLILSTEQIPQLEIQIVVLGFGSTPNVTHATLTKHNEKQISTDYKLEVKAMIK